MERVGKDGTITVEEAKGFETTLEVVEGMNFDRGYSSAYFVTNAETLICEYENAYVLIYEKKISSMKEFLPILQAVAESGKPLVIIAEDVEGEALATLVVNRLRAGLKVVAVKAPGFGDRRKAMLEDIAILTGGQFISEELGIQLEKVTLDMLGRVKKVIVKKEDTTLIDGAGRQKSDRKTASLFSSGKSRKLLPITTEKNSKSALRNSPAASAVIRVGAATEVEMKEKKDRVDDAKEATKAAVEEGIVPGGGAALIRCMPALEKMLAKLSGDVKIGAEIILRSLSYPLRQIAENAGKEGSIVVQKVASMGAYEGYDAREDVYVNMVEKGIVDPTKVVRCALQFAASIAGLLLTTEAIITEEEQEKPAPAHAGGEMDY